MYTYDWKYIGNLYKFQLGLRLIFSCYSIQKSYKNLVYIDAITLIYLKYVKKSCKHTSK